MNRLITSTLCVICCSLAVNGNAQASIKDRVLKDKPQNENIIKLSGDGSEYCPYIGYTSIEVYLPAEDYESEPSFDTIAVTPNGKRIVVAQNAIIPGKTKYVIEFMAGDCVSEVFIVKQQYD